MLRTIIGLDLEFSYPALLTFLECFKQMCESIETFGYPRIEFDYKKQEIGRLVSFVGINDDPMSSLTGSSSPRNAAASSPSKP